MLVNQSLYLREERSPRASDSVKNLLYSGPVGFSTGPFSYAVGPEGLKASQITPCPFKSILFFSSQMTSEQEESTY